ncbi:MAG: EamA family transporter [Alphaproteobacteria bacterium]|jgi:drug/metabolite transporter (DMT)-like permease|nr:EamA family transporter [Alphaproteobacteria bacterium]PPR14676.1 MAG: Riboflavin transporter [Alphaproteobacteria bacterium MarineAlpha12_Bin1]|tara:strand:+ start:10793 stop:11632 length:840 start_codon:yes stop_codon:yes gene_type:complete
MVGTLLSFTLMAIAVRELYGAIPPFEIQFFRSVTSLVILGPILAYKGWSALKTEQPKLQITRNLIHFAAQLGWITGVIMLPLSEVFAIEFTTPAWAALIAAIFLGEKLNRGRIIAVILGLIGVFIILKPGMASINPGTFAVLAAAIGFAFVIVATKSLTKTDSPLTILLYMTLIQLPIGAIFASMVWVSPNLLQLFWLFICGATGVSAHYCTARALKLADASIAAPMDFMRLPLIVLVGYVLYAESAEIAVLLGAIIIFVGNYYSIQFEQKNKNNKLKS